MSSLAWIAAAGLLAAAPDQTVRLDDAEVSLSEGELVMKTARIARQWRWNEGWLIGRGLQAIETGQSWTWQDAEPDIAVPGLVAEPTEGVLSVDTVAATPLRPRHLSVRIETRLGDLRVRRTCELIPDTATIPCQVAFQGRYPDAASTTGRSGEAGIETDRPGESDELVVDRLNLPDAHWRTRTVRLIPRTDDYDTLVESQDRWLFRQDQSLIGNIMAFVPREGVSQIFVVKEAPSDRDQVGWPQHDGRARLGTVRINGSGFTASDVTPDRWTPAYGVAVGVAGSGDFALREAVRAFRQTRRLYDHDRDGMIVSNTWGDRSRDARMSEAFLAEEVRLAAELGVTHVQFDDGWQQGLSRNSANRSGQRWEAWSREDWYPHADRFPNGLEPLVRQAQAAGVGLGLWFNPTRERQYETWARDAEIVLDAWRRWGIGVVKIDGIEVPDATADANLRAFFKRVQDESQGRVVFNVDVTAGRRPGYLHQAGYGNLFLENRYTDWANYYPHRTLRNLWMLSAWVPPQFLQIEVLNPRRNPERYTTGDLLAPNAVPLDYAFAVAMAAQPLLWMELSGLSPADARTLAASISAYRPVSRDWHAGTILPIGAEPDGGQWTGFISRQGASGTGMVLVFREPLSGETSAEMATPLSGAAALRFEPVMGSGQGFVQTPGDDGRLTFTLPEAGRYALYRYGPAGAEPGLADPKPDPLSSGDSR